MATKSTRNIYVFADWTNNSEPVFMGTLTATPVRGNEIFSFEYADIWLEKQSAIILDPNLGFYQGRQFLNDGKSNFGLFLDSSPDRWGRVLMDRREAALARKEKRKEVSLLETDYLLGVFDGHRIGGIRFKTDIEGNFLNDNKEMASPPWTTLKELEYASLQLENDDAISQPDYLKWLSLLIFPGSSLGGARPKAGVLDEQNALWIAKFPSLKDDKDSGAWEMVVHDMAKVCGIEVPKARLERLNRVHHTFLTKRFDRNKKQRIHYASAMTLLGYKDGDNYKTGISYLELSEIISRYGASPKTDLEQLWRRIVFNICVSNTDDHLRNHGFLLTDNGWKLSPAFDMNPNEKGNGLTLNISEKDNALDLDIAMDVAVYFGLSKTTSSYIIDSITTEVSKWNVYAKKYNIPSSERDLMKKAFSHFKK